MKRGTWIFVALLFLFCAEIYAKKPCPSLRIVSLAPSITDELYLLGVGDWIVGCTIYCKRPEAKGKERVGSVLRVDVEKIFSLKPDIVFATSLTEIRAIEKLKQLGIKVVVFPQPKDFEEICAQFLKLAQLVGRVEKARLIIQKARMRLARITSVIVGLKKPKVFVEIGARPLFTVTRDSYINDIIKRAGGINIASDTKSGLYSREEVVKQNPDVIVIATMGTTGYAERNFWLRFRTLKAVREGRIYIVDSYKICSPTPLSFVESVELLAKLFHPELAGKL